MFVKSCYRSWWCVLVLLSFFFCSTVYADPTFDATPCVKEVNIQPDANKNEANAFWTFPTATDENNNPAAVSCNLMNGAIFIGGTTPVTCTATDTADSSKTATCSFDVKVYPTFDAGCPSNIINETENTVDFVPPTAGNSDEGTTTEATCTPSSGSTFSDPTTEVTCTATDSVLKDQQVSCTFIVSVGAVPTFNTTGSCGEPKTIDVQPDAGKNTASGLNTWTLPISTGSTVSCEPDPESAEFVGGETIVTCTATNDATPTLFSTCEFTVRVYPTFEISDPTFETACPANIIIPDAAADVFTTPTANIDSEGTAPAAVSCEPPSSSEFTDPSTEVTCTATDSVLTTQTASCTFKISVGAIPVFDVEGSCADPAKTDVSPDDGKTTASGITWTKPTAASATVSCEPNPELVIFQGGETDVTCTAMDDTTPTLIATCVFTVRVFPAFEGNKCVGNIMRQPGAGGVSAKVAWLLTATIKDGSAATVSCIPESGSSFTGLETDVVCKASEADDVSTCSFKVSIQPSFTRSCPGDMVLAADSNGEKVVSWEPIAGNPDSNGVPAVVTCNYESGSTFNKTETVVRCVVTDAGSSLTAECSFKVILDFLAPSFTNGCPADDSVPAMPNSNTATYTWATPEVTDDVTAAAEIKVWCVPPTDSSFVFGSTAVTCVAVDFVGRTGICDFTVNVTVPVFDVEGSCADPAKTDVSPDDGKTTASGITWTKPTAASATVSCEPNPELVIFQGGETDVTCTAMDDTTPTLIATCVFTVRVFPAFEGNKCVGNIMRQPGAGGVSAKVAWLLTATIKDGSAATVSCIPESGSSFTGLETDVVCKASEADDVSTCSFKVSIQPSFTRSCPGDMVLAADSNGEKVVSWEPIAGNPDSNGVPAVVTCNYESGSTFNKTETVVRCVVTDAGSSLTAECSFKVILDFLAPSFTNGCPADDSVPAMPNSNTATYTWATPEVTDDVTAAAEIKVWCVPPTDSSFVFGSTAVTCVAVDFVGRTGICDFTVNVTGADCIPACDVVYSTCTLSDKGVSECICNDGFTPLIDNQCANKDECVVDKPCHATANCLDLDPPDMFNCSCKEGYFGDGVYSCSSAPAVFPDIDSSENLEKIFNVELAIADSSVSSCDPEGDTESVACIALVTAFKIQVAPFYKQVSMDSFIQIDVNQTSIRKGSVIIPHNVIYNYTNKDIRGMSADEFYGKSIKAAIESGMIGSFAVVKNCTSCQDPEDHTDVCAAAQCTEGYTLSNDGSIGKCIPTCMSVCTTDSKYCNDGECTHEIGKPVVCRNCPSGTTGEKCTPIDEGPDLALIIGLSVGIPAFVIIIGIIAYCLYRNSKKSKVNMGVDGGRSNDAMSMEQAGVAN